MLVDDEKALLDVFVAALSPHFDITTASNAREADFILQKKTFKVVVADHLMPGGNGMNFSCGRGRNFRTCSGFLSRAI